MLSFDHIIIAVDDYERAARRLLDVHGLASLPGGRHPGHGTGNRVVPLGPDYVELMAVVDASEAASSALGSWVDERARGGDQLGMLCLRTDDLDAVARRLDLEPLAMSRLTDEGDELRWRLAGLEVALATPPLPFFIQWDIPSELHPGRLAAGHRVPVHGLSRVELRGDTVRLDDWLGNHSLPITVVEGEPGITAAVIATDDGEIVLS